MFKIFSLFALLLILIPALVNAQKSAGFLPDKPGKWILNQIFQIQWLPDFWRCGHAFNQAGRPGWSDCKK